MDNRPKDWAIPGQHQHMVERSAGVAGKERSTAVQALGETEMHEDYRDEKIKELRDQLTRFAPKAKKVEQAALAEKLYGEIESDR